MGATGGKIRDVLEKAHFDGTVLTASDMHDAVRKAKSVASDGDAGDSLPRLRKLRSFQKL